MPAIAREPSGTLVDVLCGQPEQNQGMRSATPPPASVAIAPSLLSNTDRYWLIRACTSRGKSSASRRVANARATKEALRSALPRTNVTASPPALGAVLPTTRGRWASDKSNKMSFTCGSMSARFSSTTTISCKPCAKAFTVSGTSGHTANTLCTRTPMRWQVASSKPRSCSAWRVSL